MELKINLTALEARFLRYVAIETQSNEKSPTYPSTAGQWTLLRLLEAELKALGVADVELDAHGYVTCHLPGRGAADDAPCVGFLAHVDTSPDAPGAEVHPQIIPAYDGGDIPLTDGVVLSPTDSPELRRYIGQRLITTDGRTLLGADDKAGVAAIMEAVAYLQMHPEIAHAPLAIAFTPDEEIGLGVEHFDIKRFGADFAYTIDGGGLGELSYENFNAAEAKVAIHGVNVHPGEAKGKMRNALRLALAFDAALGDTSRPETTEGREGFFHLHELRGTTSEAQLEYLIREFDTDRFAAIKALLVETAERLNAQYGARCVEVQIRDQYANMLEYLRPAMFVVEHALCAFAEAGIVPDCSPIRGGTDGVRLSERGLPCPNLFAGGHNFHSVREYVPVPSIAKATEVIIRLAHSFTHP